MVNLDGLIGRRVRRANATDFESSIWGEVVGGFIGGSDDREVILIIELNNGHFVHWAISAVSSNTSYPDSVDWTWTNQVA